MTSRPKTIATIPPGQSTAAPPVCDSSSDKNGRPDSAGINERGVERDLTPLAKIRAWFVAGFASQAFWDRQRTPAFLLSMIVHIVLLLLLALLSMRQSGSTSQGFDLTAVAVDRVANETLATLEMATGAADPPPSPAPDTSTEPPAAAAVTASSSASALAELLSEKPIKPLPQSAASALAQLLDATANSPSASFAATGVLGREPQQRRQLALKNGGSIESEQAVESALDWLAAHQQPGGSWSLVHAGGKCNGRCANNGTPDRFDPAATGLSLLAFLGAGYTHREGKHRETVRRGIYYLLQVMEETPQGGSFLYQSERGMYNHGIAAFALCEAYQLTEDPELKKAAQQALNFIESAQNYQGGWGYLPKQPGDLTLSGWQIMSLKSGFAAGLDVPSGTIFAIDGFLDTQQTKSTFYFGYGKPGKSPTCTAIGLLLRLFRGASHTDPLILGGADYFSKSGRAGTDAYFNYYVSLFLFHVGQPFWEDWNLKMREHLIATQSKSGHEMGSWFFEDAYGREGGRLYTTAMCAMTLEVYYRFSPLYQQTEVHFEL